MNAAVVSLAVAPSIIEQRREKGNFGPSTENTITDDMENDVERKMINGSADEVVKETRGLKRDVSLSTTSSSGGDSDTKVKKARNKPKPVLIENMKEYVDNNSLEKLTTATLRHWLRQQSIHCTTRDKKEDLVQKVCKHFVVS